MLVRIESPVKGYNGTTASVKFVRGVAETEITKHQKSWLEEKGYSITEIDEALKESEINPENLPDDEEENPESIDSNFMNLGELE